MTTPPNSADSSPLVSILIPCYNAEAWIGHSIQSALDQVYPAKEVIVVDDGSSDRSVDIIREFGDRIRFQASPHLGGNAARNQLTELARGEWVQYLDADDYLLPGKIASQMAQVNQAGPDIDIVYSPVIIHNMAQPDADYVAEITDSSETLTFIRWGSLNTGGLLLKRRAVIAAGGWKTDQKVCQEHELVLRMRMSGSRFLLHNVADAVYRQHHSATVSKKDPLMTVRVRMDLTDRMAEYLESSGELTPAHRQALFEARMECARSVYRVSSQLAGELYRKARAYGIRWVSGSSALPTGYQVALRIAGFANAERLAAWMRGPQSETVLLKGNR